MRHKSELYQSTETYINQKRPISIKRDQYKRGLLKKSYMHRSAKKHTLTHTHTQTHLPTHLHRHYTHTHNTHTRTHKRPSTPTSIPTCMCVCVYIRQRIHKDTVLFECCYPYTTTNVSPKNKAYSKVRF